MADTSLTEFVPFMGERTARKRLRMVRENTVALDVLLSLAFAKTIEFAVAVVFTTRLGQFGTWIVFTLALTLGLLYEDQRKRASKAAKEKAEQTAEKVKDAKGGGDDGG